MGLDFLTAFSRINTDLRRICKNTSTPLYILCKIRSAAANKLIEEGFTTLLIEEGFTTLKTEDGKMKEKDASARTHIAIILDRTGSMESIRNDVIGGFNSFLKSQKELPGVATLTLVQFDSQDPYEVVHMMKPVAKIPDLDSKTYAPRASTPLLDAIGWGINDLEKHLAEIGKEEMPEKIVFVIITDGQENASKEFTKEQIVKMIKIRQEKDKWQFVFLSADLDSIADAASYGFKDAATMKFKKDAMGSMDMFKSCSDIIAKFRLYESGEATFSDEDRRKQEEHPVSNIKID